MIIDKEIDSKEFVTSLENLKETFGKMNRLKGDIPTQTWSLKIVRSHKVGEVQRDPETKRAWFTEGEKHLDFINNNKTYTEEENSRLFDFDKASSSDFANEFGADKLIPILLAFARTGAEAGKAKRLLDENLISWGYYTDHNPFEPHCNAHPNNFVITDPLLNSNQTILALVDLDLAYEFSSFVNTIDPDPMIFTDEENI
jgi:hypothetical protein